MIYLVIAAAVILGEPTLIPPDDCIRVRKIEVAKPHPVKRVLVHKRLFKTEPKPVIEEGCEEEPRPTVTTFFPPVEEPPNVEYSVAREVEFAVGVPVHEVLPVAQDECGCFGAGAVGGDAFRSAGYVAVSYVFAQAPLVATIPEPAISHLLLAGLGALGFIRRRRAAVD